MIAVLTVDMHNVLADGQRIHTTWKWSIHPHEILSVGI